MNQSLGFSLVVSMLLVFMTLSLVFYGKRRRYMTAEDIRQEALKQMHNKAFLAYVFGGTLYAIGLVACLPILLLAIDVDAPHVFRFVHNSAGVATYVVFYDTFWLNNGLFILYNFVSVPPFLVVSAYGLFRLEKSFERMRQIETMSKK